MGDFHTESYRIIDIYESYFGGMRWRSWLRHCAISREISGSIPDGVIEIFRWHNSSSRTMALGLTQPLTEMSTRNILKDKGGRLKPTCTASK
jgi:hypothetical protein